jgi:hypothetical protein
MPFAVDAPHPHFAFISKGVIDTHDAPFAVEAKHVNIDG